MFTSRLKKMKKQETWAYTEENQSDQDNRNIGFNSALQLAAIELLKDLRKLKNSMDTKPFAVFKKDFMDFIIEIENLKY